MRADAPNAHSIERHHMSSPDLDWGTEIHTEEFRGKSFRTYVRRPRNLASILAYADRWAQRPHVVQGDDVLSYGQLKGAAEAKAGQLAGAGVGPGDRIMLLGWNSPAWVVNFWAITALGAVPILANAWWSTPELENALEDLAPKLVLADANFSAKHGIDAQTQWWAWDPKAPPTAGQLRRTSWQISEDAPAVIVFTSGTSGKAKAVELSHRSILAGLQMLLHVTKRLPHQVDENTGDTALHTGPLFHIGGIQTLIRAIAVGDTLVMPSGKFDAGESLKLIERWKVRRWSAVPTMLSRVIEHPDLAKRNLGTLRSLTIGGAPVHGEFLARLKRELPIAEARFATGYGLTENGGQATAASGKDSQSRPGSVGLPLPCVELKIDKITNGESGEVLVRSPTQMLGFIASDENPIDTEGWLHTGDLGRIDEDGYLWIEGRSKDVIIRGGENISPVSVERALAAVPGVLEVAVFGVPHPDLGEDVMAVVAAVEGMSAEQLREQLRGRISSFAIPGRWRVEYQPLPTNPAGKIDKKLLKTEAHDASALVNDGSPS
jgi:acyl-CoA synthetase (AMP-forming)/AMP-acid ligase II